MIDALRIDERPPKLFRPSKARAVARNLRQSDPDWHYVVTDDPKGRGLSLIEVYDENGDLLGRW
ncbi:MAG: hypothetical protein ACYSWU_00855 [Planctomycetota bacterium]|jgi:hypothetical protein